MVRHHARKNQAKTMRMPGQSHQAAVNNLRRDGTQPAGATGHGSASLPAFDPSILAAFTNAREHAAEHMAQELSDGYPVWEETTVSGLIRQHAAPVVRTIKFNANQEGVNGLDWLCWWRERSERCFGMLVQAKSLKKEGEARWAIGLNQRNSNGLQLDLLLESARRFRLPATYALYTGTPEYREDLTCGRTHAGLACQRCLRASVSIVSALQVDYMSRLYPPHDLPADVFHAATPWEDIVDPALPAGRLFALGLREYVGECSENLSRFLWDEQVGAAEIAKRIFSPVHGARMLQFTSMLADPVDTTEGMVFSDLPDDRGHFREPYMVHLLQGLRTQLPSYVRDAEQGLPVPTWISECVAGIILIDV